ncbi:glutamate synthase large subunit [Gulosibacter sp. 10]|uniref:glutamate synthase large subunit n=1 Tax=Gulosibacter sp. 10 TaxID=1255570 RepID=UPI00097EC37A|nr:glutamate synthase large subunit [Gulosibacter sp. 10]SJM51373.1 Glutamate synthase [NADPH] large chain [Gulosibacter sp. 10]
MAASAYQSTGLPAAHGLYDPENERDSCGIASVATMRGTAGHDVVDIALEALRHMEHRGAVGSDAGTGDGAGIMVQVPDEFFRAVAGIELPPAGRYAVGNAYLPADPEERAAVKQRIHELCAEEELRVLGWREVPVDAAHLGDLARDAMPVIEQLFIRSERQNYRGNPRKGIALDRQAYRMRKRLEHETGTYFCSLSSRTITYKGMVTTLQLEPFYPDLSDRRFASRLAIVHSRYSTNTFPSWSLAQPLRMMAHNGEINTIRGNRNWMRARESQLDNPVLGDIHDLLPIISEGGSDSASFDEVLELLTLSGRSLVHAVHMMVPAAWERSEDMPPEVRDFFEYHSLLMEPWDGPASMAFTDGRRLVATLDRNGLRPGRFLVTDDDLVVIGSEAGIFETEPGRVVRKGRLRPGRVLVIDTEVGRIIEDDEVKHDLADLEPWGEWLDEGRISLDELPEREHVSHTRSSVVRRQRSFGYTEEELRILLEPMARTGAEPLGAMGSDTPIAVLANRPRLLFDYFTQNFAQVTNPPLDAIREELVTSLVSSIGPQENLLAHGPEHARQIIVDFPVLDNDELAKLQHLESRPGIDETVTLNCLYPVGRGVEGLRERIARLCAEADAAIENGAKFLVLSDRDSNRDWAPIPSLLATGAVHHHLIRAQHRLRVGLVVETGDVREVHHVAALLGYGATAVNPYLAMESVEDMVRSGRIEHLTPEQATRNLIKALGKGVLKIMSKMGISVIASYSGAQTFEAVGLSQEVVDEFFTGTSSRLGGVGIEVIEAEARARHEAAYPIDGDEQPHRPLEIGGEYQWRREGPTHLFNPDTVFRLQHATRERRYDIFKDYTRSIDEQARETSTLRGLFRFDSDREPIPVEEVEPISAIVQRFSTGAMSYGSISREAHETLAIAMNRLGAKSNTGEGGEDVERLLDPERRSAIKQVASARFGVTSMYLTHADDIQIKLAQGAKPGEGGQLPPQKVYPWVAKTRHATAGVGLISPPPHHDIYSIEDLKQLIFDLKRANPGARIHVKLVSENGIGAVAAGVTKALADVILVSGHDGGTGASPMNSLKHAGTPWELGLAETQQTLRVNGLRDRVTVQVDGQLKTGRDVVIGALLGAEEYGFATTALIVEGCVMMRVCHLDTCPVGVATQNPELRSRFTGKVEHVVNFFEFIAQEVREWLAELGYRSLDEIIGREDLLDTDDARRHWKAEGLDLSPVLDVPPLAEHSARRRLRDQDHELDEHFDQQLIARSQAAILEGDPVEIKLPVHNTARAVGTMLGHEVTRRHGEHGLPHGTIDIALTGTAGQSLGAFLPAGITIRLEGDSNDYVGKGLSGGQVVLRPDPSSPFAAEENVIAGNVIGYGATSGQMYIGGVVGERFLVRNSGATAVVEAVGDHALEYMTGGVAVILGSTGRNLGAGMSGGVAYVRGLQRDLVNHDALASGELRLEPLSDADADELRDLVHEHVEQTGSPLGARILADFDTVRAEFTKVLPRDYATVTEIRRDAVESGVDPDGTETWNRILEATHG